MHEVDIRRTFNAMAHFRPLIQLIRLIRTHRFLLVNTHSPVAAAIGRLAAVLSNVRAVVYTVHGFYFHDRMPVIQRLVFSSLEWCLGRYTDAFMFVSDETRR